jgi:hypothetical protein
MLAMGHCGNDFGCLMDGINPFFMIYAFADCGVALPDRFSRELLWKHLDGILEAGCWRGLGYNYADVQSGRCSSGKDRSSYVCERNDDPEGIIEMLTLFRRDLPSTTRPDSVPVVKLHITISDSHWVSTSDMGTVWLEARDLDNEVVPPFAVIDALTRILPYCQGGILEIRTNNVRLLWGICGAPSGAWSVVRSICHRYGVHLRAKWDEVKLTGLSTGLHVDPGRDVAPVLGRDATVVGAVVEELGVLMKGGAARGMADLLLK